MCRRTRELMSQIRKLHRAPAPPPPNPPLKFGDIRQQVARSAAIDCRPPIAAKSITAHPHPQKRF